MGDKKRYNNIVDDVETILKLKVTRNRKKNGRNFITVKGNYCKA